MGWMTLLLGCAAVLASANTDEGSTRFGYDRSIPLDVGVHSTTQRGGASILDLDYASPRGGRVPAYLVIPQRRGPFPAVIYGHWVNLKNSPENSNRSEFLEEAILLARAGAVTLLPDAPSARPGFKEDSDPFSPQDAAVLAHQVADVRRGVDLLAARPDVHTNRIAYVGHSFGAAVGGVLRGVEPHIQALVLMAGVSSMRALLMSDEPRMVEFRTKYGEQRVKQYLDDFDWADAVQYVTQPGKARVLVQVATHDEFGRETNFRRQAELVAEPRTIQWYDATHALINNE